MTTRYFKIPRTIQNSGMAVILERLALMVSGEPYYFNKDSGRENDAAGTSWALGRSNDYFLHRHPSDNQSFYLSSRYGTPDMVQEWTNVSIWFLGLRNFQ